MKKIILCCLSALAFLVLGSCSSSSLSPGSSVHSQYFSITVPRERENNWSLKQDGEYRAEERIWLHNGFFGSSMFAPDYPIIDMLVLRKAIPDSIVDEKMLRIRLNEIALVEVKKIVDSVWSRYIVKNFYYHHFKEKNDEYYQLHYSVYWTEEQIDTEGAIPDTVEHYFGDGICQYAIYLPESYNKYKSYYLFIYNVFLCQNLRGKLNYWVHDLFECIEDSIDQN